MKVRRVRWLAQVLVGLSVAGCAPAALAPTDGGTAVLSDASAVLPDGAEFPVPEWYRDITPITYRACSGCHREGGIAPFSMFDYATVASFAETIAYRTLHREMPPMPVNNDGTCNTYSNARWLTDAEIALIGRWSAAGAPMGNPADAAPRPAPLPELDAPSRSLAIPPYTPNVGLQDDYRCFVVDPGNTSMEFITRYQVVPGDSRVVHHVIAYSLANAAAQTEVEALDANEAGPGYTCFGGPGANGAPMTLWAPGVGAIDFPAGTGVALTPSRKVVIQIHYNLLGLAGGTAREDTTTVRLATQPAVDLEGRFIPIANFGISIPPRMELAPTTFRQTLPAQARLPATVYGTLPHMHTLGRTLRVMAKPVGGAAERCLVDVDRWNFGWQNAWWYTTPIQFPRGLESAVIDCGYDTRTRSDVVTWGESTQDEMCINYLYVTFP